MAGLVRIVSFIAGLSSVVVLSLSELKRWRRRQIMAEKLHLVSTVLQEVEEALSRYQQRHDKILFQMNAHYLCRREMAEALTGARAAMEEAFQLCMGLRRLQEKILSVYPDDNVHEAFTMPHGRA